MLPQKRRKSKLLLSEMQGEMGVSVSGEGKVFSFHPVAVSGITDRQKQRQGKVLKEKKEKKNKKEKKDNESTRQGKKLKESKKSGTRTISVREWLRRG